MPHQSPNSDPLSPFFFLLFSLLFPIYGYTPPNLSTLLLPIFLSIISHFTNTLPPTFISLFFTLLLPILFSINLLFSLLFGPLISHTKTVIALSLSLSFFSFLLVDFLFFLALYFGWYVFVFLIALLCINTFWCNAVLIAHHKSSLSLLYGFSLCKD